MEESLNPILKPPTNVYYLVEENVAIMPFVLRMSYSPKSYKCMTRLNAKEIYTMLIFGSWSSATLHSEHVDLETSILTTIIPLEISEEMMGKEPQLLVRITSDKDKYGHWYGTIPLVKDTNTCGPIPATNTTSKLAYSNPSPPSPTSPVSESAEDMSSTQNIQCKTDNCERMQVVEGLCLVCHYNPRVETIKKSRLDYTTTLATKREECVSNAMKKIETHLDGIVSDLDTNGAFEEAVEEQVVIVCANADTAGLEASK